MGSVEARKQVIAGASGRTALPAWTENAVLVYGPRKGGTTLLQNLLDGGDHLFVYPDELKLKFLVSHDWGQRHNREVDIDRYRSWSRVATVSSPRLSQELLCETLGQACP